jgi:hypothetical protein
VGLSGVWRRLQVQVRWVCTTILMTSSPQFEQDEATYNESSDRHNLGSMVARKRYVLNTYFATGLSYNKL